MIKLEESRKEFGQNVSHFWQQRCLLQFIGVIDLIERVRIEPQIHLKLMLKQVSKLLDVGDQPIDMCQQAPIWVLVAERLDVGIVNLPCLQACRKIRVVIKFTAPHER